MSLSVQATTMGMMILSGAVLGVWFDMCRVVVGKLHISRRLFPLVDLWYWFVATGAIFWVLLQSNQGRLRYYVFLGMAFGIWFYFIWLSQWIVKLLLFVIKVIQSIYSVCQRLARLLIIAPVLLLYRFFRLILGFLAAIAMFIYKIVVQLIHLLIKRFKKS